MNYNVLICFMAGLSMALGKEIKASCNFKNIDKKTLTGSIELVQEGSKKKVKITTSDIKTDDANKDKWGVGFFKTESQCSDKLKDGGGLDYVFYTKAKATYIEEGKKVGLRDDDGWTNIIGKVATINLVAAGDKAGDTLGCCKLMLKSSAGRFEAPLMVVALAFGIQALFKFQL